MLLHKSFGPIGFVQGSAAACSDDVDILSKFHVTIFLCKNHKLSLPPVALA